MKNLILSLILILPLSFLQAQNNQFARANEAYASKDFERAIALYEELVAGEKHSAALYYNLANAHYQQGALAPAILNYERALHLKPGDEETLHNLKLAQQKLVDRFEELPPNLFKAFRLGVLRAFSPSNWAILSIVFLALASLGLVLYFHSSMRRLGFSSALIGLILGVFSGWMAFQHQSYLDQHPGLIIMSESAYVKSGPGEEAEDLFILHAGTKVEQVEVYEAWTKIRLIDGKIGWLPESNLEAIF